MVALRHPNILHFIGLCRRPPCLVSGASGAHLSIRASVKIPERPSGTGNCSWGSWVGRTVGASPPFAGLFAPAYCILHGHVLL